MSSFEFGDNWQTQWISSVIEGSDTFYFPFKYQYNQTTANGTAQQYTTVLRLAEQYLIRAEAEVNSSDETDAVSDINVIRNRAGLMNYSGGTDQNALMTEIIHQRQDELFAEWGHRWFDLIRTGTVNSVMSVVTPQKGGTWNSTGALYPIPLSEITADPNLTQNPGY